MPRLTFLAPLALAALSAHAGGRLKIVTPDAAVAPLEAAGAPGAVVPTPSLAGTGDNGAAALSGPPPGHLSPGARHPRSARFDRDTVTAEGAEATHGVRATVQSACRSGRAPDSGGADYK